MDNQPTSPEASSDVTELTWMAERRALSRELHDDIAHSVLIVMAALDRVEMHQDTWEPTAWRRFSDAKEVAVTTLEKIRRLAGLLRRQGDDGRQVPAIKEGSGDLPTELSYVLREAVANALAHSQARQVVVDIHRSPDHITLVVEDDGSGFEPNQLAPHERVGLSSMYERVALVGGRLQIDTADCEGTKVTIQVPCWDT
jgi:signal transduction histidine kinase